MGFPGPSAILSQPRAGPYLRLESSSTKPCTVAVASSMWVASGAGTLIADLVPVDKDSPEWAVTSAPKWHPPLPHSGCFRNQGAAGSPGSSQHPSPTCGGCWKRETFLVGPPPGLEVMSHSGTSLGSEIFFTSCLKVGLDPHAPSLPGRPGFYSTAGC